MSISREAGAPALSAPKGLAYTNPGNVSPARIFDLWDFTEDSSSSLIVGSLRAAGLQCDSPGRGAQRKPWVRAIHQTPEA